MDCKPLAVVKMVILQGKMFDEHTIDTVNTVTKTNKCILHLQLKCIQNAHDQFHQLLSAKIY